MAIDGSNQIFTMYSMWKNYHTSGGSRNDVYTYAVNPQFVITVFGTPGMVLQYYKYYE